MRNSIASRFRGGAPCAADADEIQSRWAPTFAHALTRHLASLDLPGRTFWYVVHETNTASIRVIERAGFTLVGRGAKV